MNPRAVAIAVAASGLWFIVSRWPDYQYGPRMLSETAQVAGPWFATVAGVMMLMPVLKVGVAAGLWRFHRWAWSVGIVVLSVDALSLVSAAVRFHLISARFASFPEGGASEAIVVHVYSMWPTYVVAVVSALSLLVLLQEKVRKRFRAE